MKSKRILLSVCLYKIRSVHNVGSIFRTMNCAGIKEVFLVGTTPTPIDRFGRTRKDFAKVALGAEKEISSKYFKNWNEFKKFARNMKLSLIALEQNKIAKDYKKFTLRRNSCLILGEEVKGIPKDILEDAEAIIEIPMRGSKESLNVSVAGGIAIFRLLDI